MKGDKLFEEIGRSILEFDPEQAEELAKKLLSEGKDALGGVEAGVIPAIKVVGERFGKGEIFLPELVRAARAAKSALDILQGALRKGDRKPVGRFVVGTVEGDIHDIGKNLVSVMLSVNGWEVYDVGVNCPAEKFVTKAMEVKADVIGASALLTVTIPKQEELISYLRAKGVREQFKVMVGGAAVEPSWAESIGADGYAEDAQQAVLCAITLIKV